MSTSANTPYIKAIALSSGVVALAVIVYFIHLVKPLILYLLFAYFLVTCFRGVVSSTKRQFKLPEWIAYTGIGITFVFVVTAFIFIITDTIRDFILVQSSYIDLLTQRIDILETWMTQTFNIPRVDLRSSIKEVPIAPILGGVVNNTVSIFQLLFTFVIFMIAEILDNYTRVANRLQIQDTHLYQVMSHFQQSIQRYLVIKTFISFGTAITVYIILNLFNVDFALLWSLLTFLLNYLPVIGSVVATMLPMAIIIVTKEFSISVSLFFILTANQIFWGQFLDPKLVGNQFNLKFKTILVSIFLWGSLLGIGGIILSPLLTLAMKLISEGYKNWEWFSVIVSRQYKKQ